MLLLNRAIGICIGLALGASVAGHETFFTVITIVVALAFMAA